jgi:MFS superfamily sulfate permease-like transporter
MMEKGKMIFKIGRILFILGGIGLLFVFLVDQLVFQSFDSIPTKVIAVIATTLLVWFADSGKRDQEI